MAKLSGKKQENFAKSIKEGLIDFKDSKKEPRLEDDREKHNFFLGHFKSQYFYLSNNLAYWSRVIKFHYTESF